MTSEGKKRCQIRTYQPRLANLHLLQPKLQFKKSHFESGLATGRVIESSACLKAEFCPSHEFGRRVSVPGEKKHSRLFPI